MIAFKARDSLRLFIELKSSFIFLNSSSFSTGSCMVNGLIFSFSIMFNATGFFSSFSCRSSSSLYLRCSSLESRRSSWWSSRISIWSFRSSYSITWLDTLFSMYSYYRFGSLNLLISGSGEAFISDITSSLRMVRFWVLSAFSTGDCSSRL